MSIATEITRLQSAKADIKSAIEEKGIEVGDGLIDTYAEKVRGIESGGSYEQGYEDGKKDGEQINRDDALILQHMTNGYYSPIQGVNFDEFIEGDTLTLNLLNMVGFKNLFYDVKTSKKHIIINNNMTVNNVERMIFNQIGVTNLERLTLNFSTKALQSLRSAISYVNTLKIIDGEPLDFTSSGTNYEFIAGCTLLEELRVVPNTIYVNISFSSCELLSTESTQSIIDGLADLTGGTTQTITFNKTVGAKLTDEQKATITAKNWTLAY